MNFASLFSSLLQCSEILKSWISARHLSFANEWHNLYCVYWCNKNYMYILCLGLLSDLENEIFPLNYMCQWQLKSSVPKPDKSTFDENVVFNIIVQSYIRASNRVKFRIQITHTNTFFKSKFCFPIDMLYKFRQRNLFSSEVPKVDLFDFGSKLFNYRFMDRISKLLGGATLSTSAFPFFFFFSFLREGRIAQGVSTEFCPLRLGCVFTIIFFLQPVELIRPYLTGLETSWWLGWRLESPLVAET